MRAFALPGSASPLPVDVPGSELGLSAFVTASVEAVLDSVTLVSGLTLSVSELVSASMGLSCTKKAPQKRGVGVDAY
jgi:hypothetical protein